MNAVEPEKAIKVGDSRLPNRFWTKIQIDEDSGCWVWMASRFENGYGGFKFNGKTSKAHRVSYSQLIEFIPDGLVVRHKCDFKPCVNPNHLELGTQLDNINDSIERGRNNYRKRVRCPRNHLLINPNIIPSHKKLGRRGCLACDRAKSNVRDARNRKEITLDMQVESDRHYSLIMGDKNEPKETNC